MSLFLSIISNHIAVALQRYGDISFGCFGLQKELIVALGAKAIRFGVEISHVETKDVFAFLAAKDEFPLLDELVLLRLCVTYTAVVPLLAAWRTHAN